MEKSYKIEVTCPPLTDPQAAHYQALPPPWYRDRNLWVGVAAVLAASLGAYFAWLAVRP